MRNILALARLNDSQPLEVPARACVDDRGGVGIRICLAVHDDVLSAAGSFNDTSALQYLRPLLSGHLALWRCDDDGLFSASLAGDLRPLNGSALNGATFGGELDVLRHCFEDLPAGFGGDLYWLSLGVESGDDSSRLDIAGVTSDDFYDGGAARKLTSGTVGLDSRSQRAARQLNDSWRSPAG